MTRVEVGLTGSAPVGVAGVEGRPSTRMAGGETDTVLRYHTAPPRTAELIRADAMIVRVRDELRMP